MDLEFSALNLLAAFILCITDYNMSGKDRINRNGMEPVDPSPPFIGGFLSSRRTPSEEEGHEVNHMKSDNAQQTDMPHPHQLPTFMGYTVDERLREFRKVDHATLKI